ncbi:putative transferase [Helianthus annuus]|nr:putative transferase [Helianthus annuus]
MGFGCRFMMKSLVPVHQQLSVPSVSFPGAMESFLPQIRRDKVVIVMGATGTGKSRLSIDLAMKFPAEIINSDKMQVYKGLDITTNKVTEEECFGITHHLLGFVDPNVDFTANDYNQVASLTVETIVANNRLPIIAGGSNSYIKALVHDNIEFQARYSCCFLWVDVSLPILRAFVSKRVDRMVQAGLVHEVRRFYDLHMTNSIGLSRAIGVPEMEKYFRNENEVNLKEAIEKIKANSFELAKRQLQNIPRLQKQLGWDMHHLDATEAFVKHGFEADEAWERLVVRPSSRIVGDFLYKDNQEPSLNFKNIMAAKPVIQAPSTVKAIAVVAH